MKKIQILYILTIFLVSCQKEVLPEIEKQENHYNHQIFEENKLAPRATFFGFEMQLHDSN